MPKQKDPRRIVRSPMKKTGESDAAARAQMRRKTATAPNYAQLAGKSDAVVKKQTGRDWAAWVRVLDAENATEKPHREIARYVSSIGTPDWWSQTVAVGYERIRGLRDRGQRMDGWYETNKSRTFGVPIAKLYGAFTNARTRKRWLPDKVDVRSASTNKRMRMRMADDTVVDVGFIARGESKSTVALLHSKLPDRAAADKMKARWTERLDALSEVLTARAVRANIRG